MGFNLSLVLNYLNQQNPECALTDVGFPSVCFVIIG